MNREEDVEELAEHIYDLDAGSLYPIWAPPWDACSTGTGNCASMS